MSAGDTFDRARFVREDLINTPDKNDCAVIAFAAVTGWKYPRALGRLKKFGREPGKGMWQNDLIRALQRSGFDVYTQSLILMPPAFRANFTTMREIEGALRLFAPRRKFVINMSSHYAGFDGRIVQDWSVGRRKRLTSLWEIKRVKR